MGLFANISSYDTPAVIRLPGFRKRIKKRIIYN
nr:MAG TPA: hypothetical protein [Caudoviricetes sp.]